MNARRRRRREPNIKEIAQNQEVEYQQSESAFDSPQQYQSSLDDIDEDEYNEDYDDQEDEYDEENECNDDFSAIENDDLFVENICNENIVPLQNMNIATNLVPYPEENNVVDNFNEVKFTNFIDDFSLNQEEKMDAKSNMYMQQAIAEVDNLEKQLRVNRGKKARKRVVEKPGSNGNSGGGGSVVVEDEKDSASSLGVKVTGWMFKSVVVPPNMYVVHTRRGYKKPLNIGLGVSFRYDPRRDSFLVVPSSMQTIIISANTICKELQGILIQAYVQWIINDIETAYQRLDFSDAEDPMRVVTLQLREQAEAAIKDKVATMSINEVLSDKQPIIKELTKRLKEVAEGFGDDRGLGIKIITVQIKEAIVSSANLWQNLQKPFRSSQMATARLAEIEHQSTVNKRELEEQQTQQDAQQIIKEKQLQLNHKIRTIEQEKEFAQRQQNMELEINSYKLQEEKIKAKRQIQELEIENEAKLKERKEQLQSKLQNLSLDAELERQQKRHDVKNKQTEVEISFEEKRQQIANALSQQQIQSKAIAMMPELAKSLPQPQHSVSITNDGNGSSLAGVIASIISVLRSYGVRIGETEVEE